MSSPVEVILPTLLFPTRVTTTRDIRIEETQQVCDWDELVYEIKVPDLLGNRQELLKRILLAHGWKEEAEKLVKELHGVKAVYDPVARKITASMQESSLVQVVQEKSIQYSVNVASLLAPFAKARQEIQAAVEEYRLRKKAEEAFTRKVEQAQQEIRQHIESSLSDADKDLQKDIRETVVEYYAESVKEKAKTMGEILNIREEWDEHHEEYALALEIQEPA